MFFAYLHGPVEIENLIKNDKKSKMLSIGMILKLCIRIDQLKKTGLT